MTAPAEILWLVPLRDLRVLCVKISGHGGQRKNGGEMGSRLFILEIEWKSVLSNGHIYKHSTIWTAYCFSTGDQNKKAMRQEMARTRRVIKEAFPDLVPIFVTRATHVSHVTHSTHSTHLIHATPSL